MDLLNEVRSVFTFVDECWQLQAEERIGLPAALSSSHPANA